MRVFTGTHGTYNVPKTHLHEGGFGKVYQGFVLVDNPNIPSGSSVIVKHAKRVEPETIFQTYLRRHFERLAGHGLLIRYPQLATPDGALCADKYQKLVIDSYNIERMVLGKVRHPNIVRLLDFGRHEDLPFIVQEFCSGSTLGSMTLSSIDQWRTLAGGLLDALSALHGNRFLHNAITRANVFFDGRTAKLINLGSAVTFEEAMQGLNRGLNRGDSSPELLGNHPYDVRSDLFSAAWILRYGLMGSFDPREREFEQSVRLILTKSSDPNPLHRHRSASELKEEILSIVF